MIMECHQKIIVLNVPSTGSFPMKEIVPKGLSLTIPQPSLDHSLITPYLYVFQDPTVGYRH